MPGELRCHKKTCKRGRFMKVEQRVNQALNQSGQENSQDPNLFQKQKQSERISLSSRSEIIPKEKE